jgi:hypothetical protein
VLVYLALTAALVYGVLDTSLGYGHEDLAAALELGALASLQLGLGLAVGRWWALAVYGLAVVLAVPAGRPPYLYHDQPGPLWQSLLAAAVVAFPLIAIGVALRRLGPRTYGSPTSSGERQAS